MSVPEISASSLEYVRVRVRAHASGAEVNPTGDTVKMAFLPQTTAAAPTVGDLKAATWDSDTSVTPTEYRAQCLVGPGGTVTLTPGTYRVWVHITDAPEIPLKVAGLLKVV